MSIGMKTPAEVAKITGDRDMRWMSYRQEAIKSRDNSDMTENALPLQLCQGLTGGRRPEGNP